MAELKLNLGCGHKIMPGYVNVDKFGTPDLAFDLETFPWPWGESTVDEIIMDHVLEHLGQETRVFLRIVQELYRVCRGGAKIRIAVPHPRHDFFLNDPTHVRAITPEGLALFSQKSNREMIAKGLANTPLGIYLGVDFNVVNVGLKPSPHWQRIYPNHAHDMQMLLSESALHCNLIEQYDIEMVVVK